MHSHFDSAHRSEQQPAFYHTYEYQQGQKLGIVRLNPVVAEQMAHDTLQETSSSSPSYACQTEAVDST